MKRSIILIFCVLMTTTLAAGQTKRADVANPAAFESMEATSRIANCRKTLMQCGRDAMVALDMVGFGGEDNFTEREETFTFPNGVGIYLFSMVGTRADFTDEWRLRISFTRASGRNRFVQAGMQYRCMTNGKRGAWKKTKCSSNENTSRDNETGIEQADNFRHLAVTGRGAATLSAPCRDTLEKCGQKMFDALYKPGHFNPSVMRSATKETFNFTQGGRPIGVFLITASGFKDDSVKGERYRIAFERRGNAWHAQSGSMQYQCQRGSSSNRWTKEFCP